MGAFVNFQWGVFHEARLEILVRSILQRTVSSNITQFRFTGTDGAGNLVFGPLATARQAEIILTVPVTMTTDFLGLSLNDSN